MFEHEGAHMLSVDTKRLDRSRSGADEIPHGLVTFIGDPHSGQFAGAQQPGQRKGIPAVCLHPIAGLPWDQRWRDYHAFMAERSDQPIETIAGRTSLVAEIYPIELGGDPPDNSAHALIRRIDLAEEANLSLPASVRNRDGVPQLRDIDSDKCFPTICHGSSSCDEVRLGPTEQPSDAQCRASHLTDRSGHTVLPLSRHQ
jgi:hypothetical protein